MDLKFNTLDKNIEMLIIEDRKSHWKNPFACKDTDVIRRSENELDVSNLWRPAFVRDIEKILHLPVYNRYSDKTQVFSFYNNDDITRRSLHVQLVSRIARNIGAALNLNLDLIEAIALGHDVGHTPFGHAGERFLSELLYNETGMYFNHNVHSVRVLDHLYRRNISLQTLDGILCHNGEFEQKEYRPSKNIDVNCFDTSVQACYQNGSTSIEKLIPATLEGCVVRISDMIAYIGKDRQDAKNAHILDKNIKFSSSKIGTENAEIINNIVVDIINNSYRKDYIMLSDDVFSDLKTAKSENYKYIYKNKAVNSMYEVDIKPMFLNLYYKLLDDVKKLNTNSIIFKHHIDVINDNNLRYAHIDYLKEDYNMIVVDFIASMTDDYFIDLYNHLFPASKYRIKYISYFE